jgi:hypothetical protein
VRETGRGEGPRGRGWRKEEMGYLRRPAVALPQPHASPPSRGRLTRAVTLPRGDFCFLARQRFGRIRSRRPQYCGQAPAYGAKYFAALEYDSVRQCHGHPNNGISEGQCQYPIPGLNVYLQTWCYSFFVHKTNNRSVSSLPINGPWTPGRHCPWAVITV